MNRSSLLFLTFCLAGTTWLHAADPLSFQELSLLIRTGENPQSIVNEVARRRLLEPLTADQEATLRANGATADLLNVLHSPQLLATPETVAAYRARHTAQPASVPAQPPTEPARPAAPAAPQPILLSDRFTAGLEAAKSARNRAVKLDEAFGLGQLAEAKARAQRERKPLGFIMVWGQFFDSTGSTRNYGGNASLLHFVEAFKDSLVLVFVRHETELPQVPPAVAAGFNGPDEGGYAPNMAVVDATASELIVEIPCSGPKGPGTQRDAVFKAAAAKIQTWLTYHPMAVATPASAPAAR